MKLGYVCTNYNNTVYTRQAVETLLANRGHEIFIVVVDNHSNPENVRLLCELAAQYAEVRLILQDENRGYFAGLNVGIRDLRENFPAVTHVVIGNNDLLFGPNFIDSIVRQLPAFERHAVISPDIVTLDGMHQNPHVISRTSWGRELLYDLYYTNYYLAAVMIKVARLTRRFTARGDEAQWRVPATIYQGHGSCYFLGPLFFARFSELWAPTFLYGEEYFLSKQLRDQDMAVYYSPAITVRHCCNGAISRLPRRASWTHARNAHRVYRRYVRIFDSTSPPESRIQSLPQ